MKQIDHLLTLLHELATYPQHHASEMLRLASRETCLERRTFLSCISRGGDGVEDDLSLEDCFLGFNVKTAEGSDDGGAFGVAAAGEEPTRGFGKPVCGDSEDEGKDDLEGDGEAPS